MKGKLNEVNRMAQLAGIKSFNLLKENKEINEESIEENIEEGYDDTIDENDDNFDGNQDDALPTNVEQAYSIELDRVLDHLVNDGDDHGYGTLNDEQKERLLEQMISYLEGMMGGADLNEMAKIKDELKSAIEKVIADNPELERLPLKKAIRSDQAVLNALGPEDDIYDNQLNKFIALKKGDREVGQRGRKASVGSVAAQDIAASEPESKIKIVPSSSPEGEIDNEIGADAPSSKKDVGAANNFKNIIAKKVSKIEAMDSGERVSSADMKALKQFIKKPEVSKTLGAETIRGLVSSIIG